MVGAGSAAVTCLIVDIFGDLVSCSAACGFVCWECGLTNFSAMVDFMVVLAQLIVGMACLCPPWCALAHIRGKYDWVGLVN